MSFSVTSSQMQTKHFALFPVYAGRGRAASPPVPVTEPAASTLGGRSLGTKTPRFASNSILAPAWASSEYAGCAPPETTSRSHATWLPPIFTLARCRRPRASSELSSSRRRSTTSATSVPALRRTSAASTPASSAVTTTARFPGLIEKSETSRRTAPGSMIPGRSLPGKTSGCSIAPVATTMRRARNRRRSVPAATGTRPPS